LKKMVFKMVFAAFLRSGLAAALSPQSSDRCSRCFYPGWDLRQLALFA